MNRAGVTAVQRHDGEQRRRPGHHHEGVTEAVVIAAAALDCGQVGT
jgi:hypothetical protein